MQAALTAAQPKARAKPFVPSAVAPHTQSTIGARHYSQKVVLQRAASSRESPWQKPLPETDEDPFEKYKFFLRNEPSRGPDISRRLEKAQDVIRYVVGKLKFGPANLTTFREKSKYKNEAAGKVARSETRTKDTEESRQKWAIAARRARGGACDEYSLVTYYRVIQEADSEDYAFLCSIKGVHSFVVLGDKKSASDTFVDTTAIVVDPWTQPPFACRFQHWYFCDRPYSVTAFERCRGGRSDKNILRARRRTEIEGKMDRFRKRSDMRMKVQDLADDIRLGKKPGVKRENLFHENFHTLNKTVKERVFPPRDWELEIFGPESD